MKRVVFIGLFLVLLSGLAYGQGCSVCTKVAQGLDNKSAKGLNGGILYLAFLPLAFIGTVGFIWWRHNRNGS
jgi:hypothetical protein